MDTIKQQHYIGGRWQGGGEGDIVSLNPATGGELWRGPAAGSMEVTAAVKAARAAFPDWRDRPFAERSAFVARFVTELGRQEEALATAIHEETGKPRWESRTEVATMIAKAAVSERAYEARTGSSSQESGTVRSALCHRPLGVLAVLGPYNFPGHLPNGHIIPALLAGNTVVFKPSEFTPRCGELMLHCWLAAGLPASVLNLVQGDGGTGRLLAAAANLDGLLFTGSSATGHAIHKAFGGQPHKMLALEMGGNNPLVVDTVADLDAAVYTIIQSAFLSAGQRCTCARRLIVVKNQRSGALLARLAEVMRTVEVGSGDDCFMGPVIANSAAGRVVAFERQLLDAGGTSLVPLWRPDPTLPFLHPALVDVSGLAAVPDEECFGPLLQVRVVDSISAAIAAANDTRYGLAAGLLSDNADSWQRFQREIRAGIVNWNRPTTGASGAAPFGGIGASGNFRPGAFYAADYCAYPMASQLSETVARPTTLSPGILL